MLKHSVAPHTHGGGASLSSGCVLIRFLCCNRKLSPGALNNDSNVFLTAWKIQDQGVSQVGAWRTHLALQTETFLAACSYSGEKKNLCLFLSYKGTDSIRMALLTATYPNYLPKAPPTDSIALGIRFRRETLGRCQLSVRMFRHHPHRCLSASSR